MHISNLRKKKKKKVIGDFPNHKSDSGLYVFGRVSSSLFYSFLLCSFHCQVECCVTLG